MKLVPQTSPEKAVVVLESGTVDPPMHSAVSSWVEVGKKFFLVNPSIIIGVVLVKATSVTNCAIAFGMSRIFKAAVYPAREFFSSPFAQFRGTPPLLIPCWAPLEL
jgi:hypothetical protein